MSHDAGYSIPPYDRIQIQVSTDGGTTYSDVPGALFERYDFSCGTACWQQHAVDLSAYVGLSNLRIGFLGISQYRNNIFLDDVTVTELWWPCPSVALFPSAQNSTACKGSQVLYDYTVVNNTAASQAFTLAYTNTWPVTGPSTSPMLEVGESWAFSVTHTIPWSVDPMAQDALEVGVSGGGAVDFATATTTAAFSAGWQDYTDLTAGRGVRFHSVVYYSGKLYKIGGYDGSAAQPWLDIYDIAADTWSQGADMPEGRYNFDCVAFSPSGPKIFCAGGRLMPPHP